MNDNFGYNIEPGGHKNKHMSDKTKLKISQSLIGREFSEEHRKKISDANSRREISDETRQKMSNNRPDISGENNPMFGRHHSEETKRKIVENRNTLCGEEHPNYGKHLSNETKQKISQANKGKKKSAWHRQHLSQALQDYWKSVPSRNGIDNNSVKPYNSDEQ